MSIGSIIMTCIICIYVATIITVVINVILENRNPVRTLAWLIFLIMIPLVGIVFYIYFGVNYRKIKMFSRKELGDLKWLQYMSQDQKTLLRKSEFIKKAEREEVVKLMTLLLNNSKAMITRYNKLEILNNGTETFDAIFLALQKAKKYIHLEYYIIQEGRILDRLIEILTEKARQGVEVRFIYDDVGSWTLPVKIVDRLKSAGVQIYPFLPVRYKASISKANYRNHRKIIVIDGVVGFVGGINFADRYVDGVPSIGKWRDTHLKVRGEVVTALQIVFLIDWYFVRQELLLDKTEYLPYEKADGHLAIQTVSSGPDSDWASIQQTYFAMINMAKRNVYISTPYFMPGDSTLTALKTAAMSGVDVRIMLPNKSDSKLTYWCTRSYIEELLEAGIKVFWYVPGINHSKLIITDDYVTTVGTANMDTRSFEQNFEVNLIIYDKTVVQKLTKYYFDDLNECKQESLNNWKFRHRKHKIKESLARLFAPVL
ncbi:MAG: cardiolipin synthase [Marinifilaceae bacterium]